MDKKMMDGAALIARLESWIRKYMFIQSEQALIVALWIVGTWCFEQFYTFPYLSITGATPGCGKSTLLKLLDATCRNAKRNVGSTPAYILRLMTASNCRLTLLIDESENTSSEAKTFMSQMLNSGYQRGDTIGRCGKGALETIDHAAYCPKAFAQIGDMATTMRGRAYVISLVRGNAPTDFSPESVQSEGLAIQREIVRVLTAIPAVSALPPVSMDTREREIWAAAFGLASVLGVDLGRLTRAAHDLSAAKTAPKRKAHSVESEEDAVIAQYGVKALRDLVTVLKEGERSIHTFEAITRMKAIDAAPWRRFKGNGLDQVTLAMLLRSAHADLTTKDVKIKGVNRMGFQAVMLREALRQVTGGGK